MNVFGGGANQKLREASPQAPLAPACLVAIGLYMAPYTYTDMTAFLSRNDVHARKTLEQRLRWFQVQSERVQDVLFQ